MQKARKTNPTINIINKKKNSQNKCKKQNIKRNVENIYKKNGLNKNV